ncbi:RbsD/FucU family protein [Lysinibacter sp. HNR]|uniref:RbsD/FucU family protein n=1 Tax=Lysinibacter sp. HNR TaxID=3031408 RepID=UPI002434933A|nr:RbsD/FucU family protein [Lysinibacter sp. HNR]WGD37486.1 RbsD/FucU family protein [Lysinibacter sp. HNR]
MGIHPILSGEILLHLDRMGHSDSVVIADAHFPAHRLGKRVIELPTLTTPEVVAAIRTVLPLDDAPAIDLMRSPDERVLEVQWELIDAARTDVDTVRFVDRFEYYDVAERAYLIIRTGETRTYANALLRKGLVNDFTTYGTSPDDAVFSASGFETEFEENG